MERADLARALGAEPVLAETPAGATVIDTDVPTDFQAAFSAAVAGGGTVIVADPQWTAPERAQLAQTQAAAMTSTPVSRGWLLLPTGGTSGGVRFARHDEETIGAAVRGFCDHFGFARVNAVGVLPLHHVSGLMAWMRCALTGGTYRPWNWSELKEGHRPEVASEGAWTISLVPTQLQRLLESAAAVEWLQRFAVVFVGGGPVWPALTDAAAAAGLPVALSYGMTETAAMVTALRPAEFAAGDRSCGGALPHARVSITAEGLVHVAGESVCRGYWPELRAERELATQDLGELDARGHLHVLGRRDAVIITGGKKVHPADVEAALRATGEFEDVVVLGLPDAEWGEIVVACYPARKHSVRWTQATQGLAPHQRPKRFVALAEWPRNAQGKVNRARLRALVEQRRG